MARGPARRFGLLLVGAACAVVALRWDQVHWFFAQRLDRPGPYAVHAQRGCEHVELARAAWHDALWRKALRGEDAGTARAYLRDFPGGRHAAEAAVRIEDLTWEAHRRAGTPDGYLREFSLGRHAAAARALERELAWSRAETFPTLDAYRRYLELAPDGEHAADARERVDELEWEAIRARGDEAEISAYLERLGDAPRAVAVRRALDDVRYRRTLAADAMVGWELERYLDSHPDGAHVAEARTRLEAQLWEAIQTFERNAGASGSTDPSRASGLDWRTYGLGESIDVWRRYLARFPDGARAAEARAAIEQRLWTRAVAEEELASYEAYAELCPDGEHAADARAAASGEELASLVERGLVRAGIAGAGIESVALHVELATAPPASAAGAPDGWTVRVEAGTYFDSGSPAVQNMVARGVAKVRLHAGRAAADLGVPAACANRSRDIPLDGHAMALSSPPPGPLRDVARLLAEENAPFAVAQAAVWIVTDDATVAGLDHLVRVPLGQYPGRESVISLDDKARAFELCHRAGVDLRARKIWGDRRQLAGRLGADLEALIGTPESLAEAAEWGTFEAFRTFLERGDRIEGMAQHGVLKRDEERFVRALVASGADVDELLITSLTMGYGRWDALLVELGAGTRPRDPVRETALESAAQMGNLEIVRALLARGAPVDGRGADHTPLCAAAAQGHAAIVVELLERGALVDSGRSTALAAAAGMGHVAIVRLLLDAGAEVDRRDADPFSVTALGRACASYVDTEAAVALLLERGADANLVSGLRSPLQLAAELGRPQRVELLLAARADPAFRTDYVPTALELARQALATLGDGDFARPEEQARYEAVIALLSR